MVQGVKMLGTGLSIPGNHMMQKENQFSQVVLRLSYTCAHYIKCKEFLRGKRERVKGGEF